jgi:hypothetical protein
VDYEGVGTAHGFVYPVRVDPTGRRGPRYREAVGTEWRASSRGRYVAAGVPLTACQRIGEVGVLLPPLATVTGWASLRWRGGWWFGGQTAGGVHLPVPVAMPRTLIRVQPSFVVCTERWDPRELEVVDGLQLASAVRSVCFAMRYAVDVPAAVAALEMAAYHDLVSVDEASAWIDLHPSYTGIEQARQARDLADENSWSPREFALRDTWPARFSTPLTNRPVFDLNGRHIGTPDVIDPTSGVLGEYEGGLHLASSRRVVDLGREEDFRQHGLEPVTMVSADVPDPGRFLMRLRSAYQRAEQRPATDRRWTLELPSWWVPTFTVEQRRALNDQERAIWLRHRQEPSDYPPAGIVPDAFDDWPA